MELSLSFIALSSESSGALTEIHLSLNPLWMTESAEAETDGFAFVFVFIKSI